MFSKAREGTLLGAVAEAIHDVSPTSTALITEFNKEVSPLLPNPHHFQNYVQSMSQLSSGSVGCSPKMCADEVNAEDEGQVGGGSAPLPRIWQRRPGLWNLWRDRM